MKTIIQKQKSLIFLVPLSTCVNMTLFHRMLNSRCHYITKLLTRPFHQCSKRTFWATFNFSIFPAFALRSFRGSDLDIIDIDDHDCFFGNNFSQKQCTWLKWRTFGLRFYAQSAPRTFSTFCMCLLFSSNFPSKNQ